MNNASILIFDDNQKTLEIIKRNLVRKGYQVYTTTTFSLAREILTELKINLLITGLQIPEINGLDVVKYVNEHHPKTQAMIITDYPTIDSAVQAVKAGAENYLAKPFTSEELLKSVEEVLNKLNDRESLENPTLSKIGEKFGIIGSSQEMQSIFKIIEKTCSINSTIIINGESGTGKELVARAIHYSGYRASAPFVPINCGAIPESLLESELFGHIKGSFTGADHTKEGFFHSANKGTIFLDEISETSTMLQLKLLRVLQEKEFYMVGANKPVKIDVRILAATNKNLAQLVKLGKFREDLYYRLNIISIDLPPLRDRGNDILQLSSWFASKFAREFNKQVPQFDDGVLQMLKNYKWPGNVRELENIIQRLIVFDDDGLITKSDLPDYMKTNLKESSDILKTLEEVEIEHILRVLEFTGGNKSKAAEILSIDRKTLRKKLDLNQNK
jgi:DNA-binding NtrC family response regulator